MVDNRQLGTESDPEVLDLIVRTLVRESAQTAGLEVALPYGEGLGGRLLVIGGGEQSGAPMRGRFVRVQWVGLDKGLVDLGAGLQPGEVLALVDWADPEPDTVLLLSYEQVKETWDDSELQGGWDPHEWKFGGWCRASPERWRALVLG